MDWPVAFVNYQSNGGRWSKPNAFTDGALISGYNNIAEVKVANVYFSVMIGLGIVPDQVVLASMIDGHWKEGNSNEALATLMKCFSTQ
ncbi:hypothetical protein L1987_52835 [Smallanthus sonchifolius]|uniref:Uncharacterized protein n=1 Tax=Smallanthus sonchifolius TaxID=185202 RepID=A0ACB9EUC2_9ASTR|nr:hypothetical protein L1987_52835 [Smallanthus sonchifolius]